ncbi:helix-turn-helix domain-containing protein [Flagellimonas marinaquae]|uniref:helix-turn-helix domain-containing protein n=1 Tax=Flagellimonas marinaquae TaxID=254955 RepID=UPI000F8E66D0|nr:helix-turn-helix transcriptional regulator [Allomuricauda aquimarina]
MNDNSHKKWYASSDKMLGKTIGNFIKHHRTEQRLTQSELANKANISRSTLSLLERGEAVTLSTLIRVLRVLNLLHIMDVFSINKTISPIALAKAERARRQRVRTKTNDQDKTDSEW